jgi:hypothetical protein
MRRLLPQARRAAPRWQVAATSPRRVPAAVAAVP